MTQPTLLFLISGVLLVVGALWRELSVPADGALRSGLRSTVLAVILGLCTVLTAAASLAYLKEVAL